MKTPLIERMEKAKAPKTWIREVKAEENRIELLLEIKETYLNIIDRLSREKEQLEAELEMYERDETFGTLAIQLTQLEAEIPDLKKTIEICSHEILRLEKKERQLEAENEEFQELFVYFFGENYEGLTGEG